MYWTAFCEPELHDDKSATSMSKNEYGGIPVGNLAFTVPSPFGSECVKNYETT